MVGGEPAGAEGGGGADGCYALGDFGTGEPEAEGFDRGVVDAGDGEERLGGIGKVGKELGGLVFGRGEARENWRLGGEALHGRVGDHAGIVP